MTPQTAEVTQIETQSPEEEWQPPMPPTDLIFDDGEPLESSRHRVTMNALIRSYRHHCAGRNNFFVGGNMFVYYSSQQVKNKEFKGPDFFIVLDVPPDPARQGWVVWEENGRYPDMIVELLSDTTEVNDLGEKKALYEKVFKTKDYFVFHPFKVNSLQGWRLDSYKGYQPIEEDSRGWLWCESLHLWLGTWKGVIEDDDAVWLRFYDEVGNLVLLPEEAEQQRADTEQQRADAERQARLDAVSQLLQMGLSVEQVAQALSLTVQEVEAVR
ncbi:Uma2 family endonuclease [Dulcicalothrix desertica]|nr:Uma2 family endonuclease [Dulcicalothrix desertica]